MPIISMAPAYKKYLPEQFRARSGPYFPVLRLGHFFERHHRPQADAIPKNIAKTSTWKKSATPSPIPSNALAIGLVRELDLAVELAKAYNNWACDFCRSSGNRVKYAAVIAPQVVPEAVKEVRRAVTEKGAVGVMMPTYVQQGLDLGPARSSIRFTPRRRSWACPSAFTPPPKWRSATRVFINISACT